MEKEKDKDQMEKEKDKDQMEKEKDKDQMEMPSYELAKQMLTKVKFENRFIGSKLRERTGPQPVTSYSFKEVVELIQDRIPGVNLANLEKWVREVLGDGELADEILKIAKKDNNYMAHIAEVRDLMTSRLEQCLQAVEPNEADAVEPNEADDDTQA